MKKRNIGIIMVITMFLLLASQIVFAETKIQLNTNDSGAIQEIIGEISKAVNPDAGTPEQVSIKTKNPTESSSRVVVFKYVDSGDEKSLEFNESGFINADQKEAKKVLEMLIDGLRTSSISANSQQAIMTQIQESDNKVSSMMIPMVFDNSQADLFGAYKIIHPFLKVLSVILGLAAYLIIILLLGSTTVDLLYIGLPVWREKADSTSKNTTHPFGVSYEAMTTVKEVEAGLTDSGGAYRNAYIIYFKRRALSYIVLAICILYLVAGQLGGIITFVLDLVSGFM